MTPVKHEIPSDEQVIAAIDGGGGAVKAPLLIKALIEEGYVEEDVVRAIQRTMERGKIALGAGLQLVIIDRAEAA